VITSSDYFCLTINMKKIVFALFLSLFLWLWGCKKNVVEPQIEVSSKYVPIDSGYSWTYQMDSIVYSGLANAKPDTFSYKIKNTVVATFIDNAGQTSFRLEKWYLPKNSNTWLYARTYSETKSNLAYFRNDFDQTQLVVSLPVLQDKTWNGNQYNSNGFLEFYFDEVHTTDSVGMLQYDSVCTIMQDESLNAIRSFYAIEKYAANVGLIWKETERLENLNTSTQKGFKYKLALLEFEQ
jgi:hypothetical protein